MMALEEKELKIFSKYFPIHDDTNHALDGESSQHCDCLPAHRSQAGHNDHHTDTQYASGPLHIPVDMMDVSG